MWFVLIWRRSWGWDKEVLISVFEGVSSEAIKDLY
jgi:hypothetical protein